MKTANTTYAAPRRLNKYQRAIRAGLESAGLGGLDIRIGETPVLDLPADDLRRIAFRLWNPNATDPPPPPPPRGGIPARRRMISEVRGLQVQLGAMWVREHGSRKYGCASLPDLTDQQLVEVHAASTAAVATLMLKVAKYSPS